MIQELRFDLIACIETIRKLQKANEYDQEMPHSHIKDQTMSSSDHDCHLCKQTL